METEKEKYPRLTERLRRALPEGRVARIHEFATDLAIGYEEGAWDSRIRFMKMIRLGETIFWKIDETFESNSMLHSLKKKWPDESLPDFEAMWSFDYLVEQQEMFNISEKTLLLADSPATSLDVFISYKRDKSSEFALLLHSRIKYETNATPFVDHNLKPGDEWHAKLEQKVADCDAFICLLAPGTLCSPFVQKEIKWALAERENNNRLIIPVWHKSYVSIPNSPCDKISDTFNAVEVTQESAKQYNSGVDEVLNRLGYSTAFLERRRSGIE